jgi:hypothetical protein
VGSQFRKRRNIAHLTRGGHAADAECFQESAMTRSLIPLLGASALALLGSSATANEKPKSGCSEVEARQFDFWIGHWNVAEKDKPAGTNTIERILEGCALIENWSSAQGGSGKSLNFFDRADGKWHQTWIDASGGALFLSGRFENGTMRMEGERPAEGKQAASRHRITWTPLAGGKVRQLWESSPIGKEAWAVQFDGLYTPGK